MNVWRKAKLQEIAAKKRWALNGGPFGSKLTTKHYTPSGVPVIRGTNLSGGSRFSFKDFVWVSEEKAEELLPNNAHPGDLVFTQRGTIGQVGLIPLDAPFRRFVISQSQMKLTPDPEQADALFLYYYFSAPFTVRTIENLAFAAGVPHINLEILRNFEVPIPPLQIQRRIAGILSAYDELIANAQQRIEVLQSMASVIYREWFVHFRFPGHENQPRVASPLGEIPAGWEVRLIADLCESVSYGYTASASREEVGPKFLRITDIVPDLIDWAGVPFCEIPQGKAPKYLLEPGDIVVARTGATTGYAKRLNKRHPAAVFASYLVRVRAARGVSNRMLGILMESAAYKQFIKANIGGAAQPQANAVVLTSMRIAAPPAVVAERFDRLIEPLLDAAELLALEIQNLRRTRDLLLPRLLSGETGLAAA